MILKICSEFPVMYIPMAFIGSCFAGARASSQAFLSLRVSISDAVGGLRGVTAFLEDLEERDCCRAVEVVKPGGSGKVPCLGLEGGAEARSRAHWGGGGGGVIVVVCCG